MSLTVKLVGVGHCKAAQARADPIGDIGLGPAVGGDADVAQDAHHELLTVTHDRDLAKRCGRMLELDAGHTVNGKLKVEAATGER